MITDDLKKRTAKPEEHVTAPVPVRKDKAMPVGKIPVKEEETNGNL